MTKVLFIYRYCGLGGVETSILTKLRSLEKFGIEGSVLFSEYCGVGGASMAVQPRVWVGLSAGEVYDFLGQKFDMMFVVDYPDILVAIETANITTPVLFESHASFPPLVERFHRSMNHPRIAAIVVPSSFNKALVQRFSRTTKDVFVIPNPVNVESFGVLRRPKGKQAGEQLHEGPVILWIGRLEAPKNPKGFISIAKRLIARGSSARFVIIGDVWNHDEYKAELLHDIDRSDAGRFTFIRSVSYDEMPSIYGWVAKSGGCLVSTSYNESQPMIFLEAMASGCPIVASDIGGVPELITDGMSGRLYGVGDMDHAETLVTEVIDGDKSTDRARLISTAKAYVAKVHSLDKIGQLYADVIERFRSSGTSNHTYADAKIVEGLVTTIIPVYNRPRLIAEAVQSVASQTYPCIELIIVDDGSTDETASVCDELARKYGFIKVVHQRHTGLPGCAREVGRLLARGEYIQYLDSDDLLLPHKFAVMTKALGEHPECDIAYCYTRRYVRGEPPRDIPCERTGETFTRMLPEFVEQRFWHTCTPLYRRILCDKAGPWSDLAVLEDMEYDMRIAKMDPHLFHCKEFLAEFRDHSEARLSTAGFLIDPESLARLPRAFRLIYDHCRSAGLSCQQENLRAFLVKVAWLSYRCAELHLKQESEELAAIVREADETLAVPGGKGTTPVCELSCLTRRYGETLFCLDVLNERIVSQETYPIRLWCKEKRLLVTGWAVDQKAQDTARGVYVAVDGIPYKTFYSSDRKDVADHFGVPQYRYSGFEALVPDITAGLHSLSLIILTKDGDGYYRPDQTVEFIVITDDSLAGGKSLK